MLPILTCVFFVLGTNGGVSSVGLWASLLGGLFIGVIFYVMTLLCAGGDTGARQAQQWLVIVVAGLSGLVGLLVDCLGSFISV